MTSGNGAGAPDMTPQIPPALDAAQWKGVLASADRLEEIREGFAAGPFSTHALAAILLYGEPYGFTHEDVRDEKEVAVYCDKMATDHAALGDEATAASFRLLATKHRDRAARIAALLPPT